MFAIYLGLEILWGARFRVERQVTWVEKASKQPRIQAVAWSLVAPWSHIYFENQEQRAKSGDLNNRIWAGKEWMRKVWTSERSAP